MPFIDEHGQPVSGLGPQKLPDPEVGPGLLDTLGAAFKSETSIGAFGAANENRMNFADPTGRFTPEAGFDPTQHLAGTALENDPELALGARSMPELQSFIRQAELERERNGTLEKSGGWGKAVSIAVGLTDPLGYLIPGGEVVAGLRAGARVAQLAGRTALAGGAAAAAQDAAIREFTITPQSNTQTAVNVASATLLSGLLGGAAGLLTPGQFASLTAKLDLDRENIARGARGEDPVPLGDSDAATSVVTEAPTGPTGTSMPVSGGAAASDTRDLELQGFILDRMPGLNKAMAGMDPMMRTFTGPFVTAKRNMADLAETPLRFEQNKPSYDEAGGLARPAQPTTDGPAISRMSVQSVDSTMAVVGDDMDRLFMTYRYNKPDVGPIGAMIGKDRASLQGLLGQSDMLTPTQFDEAVGEALMSGDTHAIPQVQEAAQILRRKVYDPWWNRVKDSPQLREAFGIPEDADQKTAQSYFMRVWNKERINAKRPEVQERFTGWLESEQTTKAAAQARIANLNEVMGDYHAQVTKLERQIERRSARLETVETRADEVQRFNQFAYQRSSRMSEPLDQLREQIGGLEQRISPQLQRLQEIAEGIRTEKAGLPGVKEADSNIFRLIGAAQKVSQGTDLIDKVQALSEFSNALRDTRAELAGGIRAASGEARRARLDEAAQQLVALEKERGKINQAVRPYRKQLRQLKSNLRKTRQARIQNARGGAVFESRIRERGNTLADQRSGRAHELDRMHQDLAQATAKRDEFRAKIEEELAAWQGKSATEVKSALKRRAEMEAERQEAMTAGSYKGKAGRLTSADDAVNSAVRRILQSDRGLSRQELHARAGEIIDRIVGSPDGRLPYDAESGGPNVGGTSDKPRGPLAKRPFAIPDHLVKDLLDMDARANARAYLRTMVPDILLTERFGDVDMSSAFKSLREEHEALSLGAKSEKARVELRKQYDAQVRDMAAVRDRIRGIYGSDSKLRMIGKLARNANILTGLTTLGGSTINSMSDMAGVVFQNGLMRTAGEGYKPWIKSLVGISDGYKRAQVQYRAMGIAIETRLNARSNDVFDFIDAYKPHGRIERVLHTASDRFQLANLQAPWTDMQKTIAAVVSGNEMIRASKAVADGRATSAQLERLAASGIDANMARRIWENFDGTGEVVDGVHLPNTHDWRDARARTAFEGAVGREVDIAVITPGQEKPLWLSTPVGATLGQFKTFTAASTQRILVANLQRRDAATLSGLMASVAGGTLSYVLYSLSSGRPLAENPADWVREGVSRSGVLGWLEEGNTFTSKLTGGQADLYRLLGSEQPVTKYASRSALGQLLGPTAGKLQAVYDMTNDLSQMQWTAKDTHKARLVIGIGQNHPLVRRWLDQIDPGAKDYSAP